MKAALEKLRTQMQTMETLLELHKEYQNKSYENERSLQEAKIRYQENAQKIMRLTIANKRLLESIEITDKP